MTVAIYGGSFNPPHIGHLSMVLQALLHPDVTRVMVVPCFQQQGKDLISFEHRMNMARLAFGDLPDVTVDPVEEQLGDEVYTYRMVEAVRDMNPHTQFMLILGEDLRSLVSTWKHPERIQVPMVFFPRTPLSSTFIRRGLKLEAPVFTTKSSNGFLPVSVAKYIKEQRLYQ